MPNIVSREGNQLNAAYQIERFQGVFGLILDSWGPSERNKDYNLALDIIIERLQRKAVGEIGVNVISRELVVAFPIFADRAIVLDSTGAVSLRGRDARAIRLDIGRAQAGLKVDPSKSGGNRTKRILLHSEILNSSDWTFIASQVALPPLVQALPIPAGNHSPDALNQMTAVIERDAEVRQWVLKVADGVCELCRKPAPFRSADGIPFLEVHHVVPLSTGGPDTISNTVALCPNCHRELHHGLDRGFKLQCLYNQVLRIIKVID